MQFNRTSRWRRRKLEVVRLFVAGVGRWLLAKKVRTSQWQWIKAIDYRDIYYTHYTLFTNLMALWSTLLYLSKKRVMGHCTKLGTCSYCMNVATFEIGKCQTKYFTTNASATSCRHSLASCDFVFTPEAKESQWNHTVMSVQAVWYMADCQSTDSMGGRE